MINLIPNQDKKKMTRDFYTRLIATAAVMLGFVVVIGCVAMMPAYFLSTVKKNLANSRLETQSQKAVPEPDQQTLAIIKDLNQKVTIIENAEKNKFSVADKVVKEIISKKTGDIKITQISFQNDPTKGKIINVTGTAPDRDRLLKFRQTLGNDTNFKSVDLPISNFLKGADIEFSLALIAS